MKRQLYSLRYYLTSKRFVAAIALCLAVGIPQPAFAQSLYDLNQVDVNFYSDSGQVEEEECAEPAADTDIDAFLKALAQRESGGDINAVSGTGARGKYQYIDSTWVAHAAQYYPPASAYPTALDPPEDIRESVQDALAFFEYTQKFKDLDGDLFKLAVSHFYPAALENESLMDITPEGNVITPREYGNAFVAEINAGAGKDIPLKYTEAPEFAAIAAERGVTAGESVGSGETCENNGAVAGDIVETALNFAWDTRPHGPTQADAKPSYQEAMPEFNGSGPVAGGEEPYSDCGVFVATVMIASGADPDYPKRGTSIQMPYVQSSDKYTIIDNPQSTDVLEPGDILITNDGSGHTYIYTGPYQGGKDSPENPDDDAITWNAAGASNGDHVPEATNFLPSGGAEDSRHYIVARLK